MRRLTFLWLILFSSGCATTIATAPATAPPSPSSVAVTPHFSDDLRWVRTSAEYRAIALEVYRLATARAEVLAASRAPGSWAVILDADETVLDNSGLEKELQERREIFTDAAWRAWVQRRARQAVPGAAAFIGRVRELGGRVAIVTNTVESLCADTAANFVGLGIAYDVMLCRPDGGDARKEGRFAKVADGTALEGLPASEVVLWVGDNIQDFPGLSQAIRREPDAAFADFGVRFFVLPNPSYGSWERNPPE